MRDTWHDDINAGRAQFFGNDIMSVAWHAGLNAFVAVYSVPASRTIAMRTAPGPTGPWSAQIVVTEALPSNTPDGWVYDAVAHAEWAADDAIHVTYTREGDDGRELRLLRITVEPAG